MTIHSLYIFSRRGTCLYYTEWYRPRNTLSELPEEDRKLMFGLLFSLKQLMNKMHPGCVRWGIRLLPPIIMDPCALSITITSPPLPPHGANLTVAFAGGKLKTDLFLSTDLTRVFFGTRRATTYFTTWRRSRAIAL